MIKFDSEKRMCSGAVVTVLAASLMVIGCGGGTSGGVSVSGGNTVFGADTSGTTQNDNLVRVRVPLSDDETEPQITAASAIGDGNFTYDNTTGVFSGSLTVSGMTQTPTSATINVGAPGEVGPVLITLLGSNNGLTWTIPAGTVLDAAGVAALAAGNIYANVVNSIHPSGEIRGQIAPNGDTTPVVPTAQEPNGPLTTGGSGTQSISITFRNTSGTQPLSPPVVVLHNAPTAANGIQFFEVTQPASSEIVELAENGNIQPLVDAATGQLTAGTVSATAVAFPDPDNPGPIGPGGSSTLVLNLSNNDQVLSFASMVVCTNDGFTGVNSRPLSTNASETFTAPIYDAGSETNVLSLNYWVPPCSGDAGTSENLGDAENGSIRLHPGQNHSENPVFNFKSGAEILEVTITRN